MKLYVLKTRLDDGTVQQLCFTSNKTTAISHFNYFVEQRFSWNEAIWIEVYKLSADKFYDLQPKYAAYWERQ